MACRIVPQCRVKTSQRYYLVIAKSRSYMNNMEAVALTQRVFEAIVKSRSIVDIENIVDNNKALFQKKFNTSILLSAQFKKHFSGIFCCVKFEKMLAIHI